jgi:protein O-mannosyl-transferase
MGPVRVIALVLAVFWVYSPALSAGWFWDDTTLVVENGQLRSLSTLGSLWLSNSDWPLSATAFWIEWHLWGQLPFGYHAVNIALHLANAFLVWNLFSRLGLRWAWLAGLLFAIHPLAVESVAWISELKNTLSLLFFLLSLLAWIDQDEGKHGYIRSLCFYILAMFCKTSVVMLPAVLLLYAWWKRGVIKSSDLKKTIPFFAIAFLLGISSIHFQSDSSLEMADVHARSLFVRCLEAGASICFYLGKFIWPFPLMPVYPRWSLDSPTLLQFLAPPFLASLFFGLWIKRKEWSRHLLLGLGFFVLTLLPVIGLIDMSFLNFSWVADHFVYLPMIGLIGLIVLALQVLSAKLSVPARILLLALIAITFFFLARDARHDASRFANEEKMWSRNVNLNPSAWAAHNNLGYAMLQSGRVTQAEKQFKIALTLNPLSAEAHNNHGVVFLQTGAYPQSIEEFQTALRLNPHYTSAQTNLDLARQKQP